MGFIGWAWSDIEGIVNAVDKYESGAIPLSYYEEWQRHIYNKYGADIYIEE